MEFKRHFSVILCLLLCIGCFPVSNYHIDFVYLDIESKKLYTGERYIICNEDIMTLKAILLNGKAIKVNGYSIEFPKSNSMEITLYRNPSGNIIEILFQEETYETISEDAPFTIQFFNVSNLSDELNITQSKLIFSTSNPTVGAFFNFEKIETGIIEKSFFASFYPEINFRGEYEKYQNPRLNRQYNILVGRLNEVAFDYGKIFYKEGLIKSEIEKFIPFLNSVYESIYNILDSKTISRFHRVLVQKTENLSIFTGGLVYDPEEETTFFNIAYCIMTTVSDILFVNYNLSCGAFNDNFINEEDSANLKLIVILLLEMLLEKDKSLILFKQTLLCFSIEPKDSSFIFSEYDETFTNIQFSLEIGMFLILKIFYSTKELIARAVENIARNKKELPFMDEERFSWMETWTEENYEEGTMITPYIKWTDGVPEISLTEEENSFSPRKLELTI